MEVFQVKDDPYRRGRARRPHRRVRRVWCSAQRLQVVPTQAGK